MKSKIAALLALAAVLLFAGSALAGISWVDTNKSVNTNSTFSLDVWGTGSGIDSLGVAMTFDTTKFGLVSWTPTTSFTVGLHNGWTQFNDESTMGYSYEGIFNPVVGSLNAKIGTLTLQNKMGAGQSSAVTFYNQDPNGWAELYTYISDGTQHGQSGSVLVSSKAVVTPEPSSLVVFGMAGIGCVGSVIRRRVRK